MKNSEYTDKLNGLLEKYKLKDVITADDQQFMLNEKSYMFSKIMKSVKKVGIFAAVVTGLYFFFKKHALLSMVLQKTIIILTISSVIGGSSYVIYNSIIKKNLYESGSYIDIQIPTENGDKSDETGVKNTTEIEQPLNADIKDEKTESKAIDLNAIKYDIRIRSFKSTVIDKSELSKMAEKFRMYLQKDSSEKFAIVSNVINTSNCNHVLSFSIEENESEFVINVKMVDINTSKIEMLTEYTAGSIREFDRLWPKISKDVRSKIE